ncbi:SDR family oxidoreductase [Amycolatopsis sp. YIM 10]|uniref:SDR family oxidoreductase n=1 Tax=Amycolatopsis sp. YIM 10 TaxID=2653857 RepID=UPI00129044A5|nr:SDR family oxidoreductase [Amycolatopsis sp. YIM 10]QFU93414.1 NmrA-like family protein [Amycolatopsis sp. YIM 10]
MKIVVIGGTGLIGSKLVGRLRASGHEVTAAAPSSGVNTLTGEGLAGALDGARVVADVSNSPSFEDNAVLEFFTTSSRNLLAAEAAAGVGHHVALSVVGAERLPDSGYMRAKVAQEKLIKESGVPYSILRATQFFEFLDGIAGTSTDGNQVRLSPALFQPVAAEDVAATLADVVLADPVNGTVELAGPEPRGLADIVREHLAHQEDPREVVADEAAGYFGAAIDDRSLTPGENPRLGKITYKEWLAGSR